MNDNLTIDQRVQQFCIKHGNDAVPVDGWLLYSDGAKRERMLSGALVEPPNDPEERCRLQVKYHEARLRRATQAFEDLKNTLGNAAKACFEGPAPQLLVCDEQLQQLKELQQAVRECQSRLDEARERLKQAKPDSRRAYEAALAVNRERGAQFIAALNQIQI